MSLWADFPRGNQIRKANNFMKGLQTNESPFFVDENSIIDGYGWDFNIYPALAVRSGRTAYGTSGNAITRLLTNFGNQHLVRAVGTVLQYNSGGTTWTNIATGLSNTDYDSTNFDINGEALIITNGVDTPSYWDGTTRRTISQMPKGKYVASDNRRVYTAGVSGEDDVIHFCAFQDATDWTGEGSDAVQFYTPNGGGVTALKSFAGQIWAFKRDSYALIFHTGNADITHRLVEGSNDIGCVAYKTVQEVGEFLIWLGQFSVYIGAGGDAADIGEDISRYLGQINQNAIENSFAFVHDLKYYLCIPTGNNTQPDTCLVYDTRHRRWLPYSKTLGGLRWGASLNGVPYAADTNGQTFKMNDGTTDNGAAIPYLVESRPFDDGVMEAEKELYEMHIQGYFPSGTSLNVDVSTDDRSDSWTRIEYDPTSIANVTQNKNMIVPLDTVPLTNFYRYRLSGQGYAEIQQIQRYSRIQPVQI